MPLGLNIVLNADGSKAVANIGAVESAMNSLTNTVKGELTQKMKLIFSAAAIEQAAQRTGQWAQQLTQTAQAMGITNTALQTLNILAQKTNTPEDAVISMFTNIDKARTDAINGNKDLAVSFQRLGISMEQLKTMKKSELFGAVMSNPAMANISSSDIMTRNAVQDVTGGIPENFIQNIKSGLGDQSFTQRESSEVDSGNIPDENSVSMLSKTWGEFMVDMTELGNELKPAAGLLIGLFREVVVAIMGVIDFFKDVWQVVSGLFYGDGSKALQGLGKIGYLFAGIGMSLVKMIAGLMNILIKGIAGGIKNMFGWIPVVGKQIGKQVDGMVEKLDLSKAADTLSDSINDSAQTLGIKRGAEQSRRGEAVGNVATTVLTGGESAIAKVGLTAVKGMEKIGLAGKITEQVTTKLKTVASGKRGFFGNKTIGETLSEKFENSPSGIEMNQGVVKRAGNKYMTDEGKLGTSNGKVPTEAEANAIEDRFYKGMDKAEGDALAIRKGLIRTVAQVPALVVTGTAGALNQVRNQPPNVETSPLQKTVGFASAGGSDSSMLKIGGLFGSNFQSKMIQLNTDMVRFLAQISTNTAGGQGSQYAPPSSPPPGNQTGGTI